MDWEKYWSDKSDDGHTDPTPEGIAKEGREKLFHLGSGDRLLDVGCGTGKLISHYTANFRECIGVERSPTMLAEAQTKLRNTNIALLHGSAENVWEIVDGDFDAITMGRSLNTSPPTRSLLSSCGPVSASSPVAELRSLTSSTAGRLFCE